MAEEAPETGVGTSVPTAAVAAPPAAPAPLAGRRRLGAGAFPARSPRAARRRRRRSGPRAAVPHGPGDAPQGRAARRRARLSRRCPPPPGPAAPQRRSVHHASAGGGPDPGRARHDPADAVRRPAARHWSRTRPTASTRCARDFGDEVADLVDGVTKLDKVKYGDAPQAETVRKMVVAMARDIRVLVIKLADRLHNMRTMRFLPLDKQEQKARETLEIYAPLAHRLGMNTLKWELEDLAFAILYPEDVRRDRPARRRAGAQPRGVPGHRRGPGRRRPARGQGPGDRHRSAEALLLRLPEDDRARPRLRRHLRPGRHPRPGRLRPRLLRGARGGARPVEPGARAVQGLHRDAQVQHVPVVAHDGHRAGGQAGRAADPHLRHAPDGRVRHRGALEVQGGPAAVKTGKADRESANEMAWLRQLLDWQRETTDPGEFLDSLRFDLGASQVFVFTPKGDVIALPQGATPVDFAYAVHTEVGHRCVGARVNGKLVPLESALDNGDVVEVFTSKAQGAGPSPRLAAVRQERPRPQQDPGLVLQGAPRGGGRGGQGRAGPRDPQAGAPAPAASCPAASCSPSRRTRGYSRHHRAVRRDRRGSLSPASVVQRLVHSLGGEEGAVEDIAEATQPTRGAQAPARTQGDPGVVVRASRTSGSSSRSAARRCPATRSAGFVTRGNGVSVHRADCANVASLSAAGAAWSRSSGRRRRRRCSSCRSRSRRSTGRGCCPT